MLVAWKWNPSAILTLTSQIPRSKESAEKLLQGFYPMSDKLNQREVLYMPAYTPITGTSFEHIINGIYYGGKEDKQCLGGAVQEVQ